VGGQRDHDHQVQCEVVQGVLLLAVELVRLVVAVKRGWVGRHHRVQQAFVSSGPSGQLQEQISRMFWEHQVSSQECFLQWVVVLEPLEHMGWEQEGASSWLAS
jgi:hypothetical protein